MSSRCRTGRGAPTPKSRSLDPSAGCGGAQVGPSLSSGCSVRAFGGPSTISGAAEGAAGSKADRRPALVGLAAWRRTGSGVAAGELESARRPPAPFRRYRKASEGDRCARAAETDFSHFRRLTVRHQGASVLGPGDSPDAVSCSPCPHVAERWSLCEDAGPLHEGATAVA